MKNESIRKIINVDKPNYSPIWSFKQEDDGVLRLSLFKGSTALDITGQTVKLGALRADRTLVELEAQVNFTVNKNELDITLNNNMLSIPGITECDLTLTDASGKMTTASFFIEVKKKTTGLANILGANLIEGLEKLKSDFKSSGDKLISAFSKEYESLKKIIIDENQAANLQDQVNQTNAHLETMAKLNVENESIQLGEELLNTGGWTSIGWSGDFMSGFTHEVGQSTPLRKSLEFSTSTKFYLVSMRLTPTCQLDGGNGTSDFTVTIGNSTPFITYQGKADTKVYAFGIRSVSDGDLVITPEPRYNGIISEISVKEILGEIEGKNVIRDTDGSVAYEIRPTKSSLKNVYLGTNVGKYNTDGNQNAIVGADCFTSNTSGYWNSALGYLCLADNTVGSRNVAIGYTALAKNIGGDRNIGIGTFALCRNTAGRNNIGIGADTLWYNTIGNDNVAISLAALAELVDGQSNIGIGIGANASNQHGNYNISLGKSALTFNNGGSENIAIGCWSLFANKTQSGNVAIGHASQRFNENGNWNVSLGRNTLTNMKSGGFNVAIGENAGKGDTASNFSACVLIGSSAGEKLSVGADNNTFIGASAGSSVTTGSRNVMIGIGANPLNPTDSNKLNIADVLYGDRIKKGFYVGGSKEPEAYMHLHAGTGTFPTLKLDKGVLLATKQGGVFEYDGFNLYFTLDDGSRKKFTFIDA